jgi:hypothetical protein
MVRTGAAATAVRIDLTVVDRHRRGPARDHRRDDGRVGVDQADEQPQLCRHVSEHEQRSRYQEQGTTAPSSAALRPVRTIAVTGTPSGTTYQVSICAEEIDRNCRAHAHGGAVVTFLAKHPCTSMTRRLGTTTVEGKAVGFALTTIRFPSGKTANAFRVLVTKDGTGNLDDLLSDGKRLPAGPRSLPNPDGFSSADHDADVLVVDSWYLTGSTPENDPPLTALANDFFGRTASARPSSASRICPQPRSISCLCTQISWVTPPGLGVLYIQTHERAGGGRAGAACPGGAAFCAE